MQVIKLSDAIQPLPRSVTQFVHGVAKPFLATGELMAASRGTPRPGAAGSPPEQPPPPAANGVEPGKLRALGSRVRVKIYRMDHMKPSSCRAPPAGRYASVSVSPD